MHDKVRPKCHDKGVLEEPFQDGLTYCVINTASKEIEDRSPECGKYLLCGLQSRWGAVLALQHPTATLATHDSASREAGGLSRMAAWLGHGMDPGFQTPAVAPGWPCGLVCEPSALCRMLRWMGRHVSRAEGRFPAALVGGHEVGGGNDRLCGAICRRCTEGEAVRNSATLSRCTPSWMNSKSAQYRLVNGINHYDEHKMCLQFCDGQCRSQTHTA